MNPREAAQELRDELDAALGASASPVARVRSIVAPEDLGADRFFRVTVARPDGRDHVVQLPVPLAMGYLADEEAAVDEWKAWVAGLSARI